MYLVIKDFQDFSDWDQALGYLREVDSHFLLSRSYPPDHIEDPIKKRIIILGENQIPGFYHVPAQAHPDVIQAIARLIFRQIHPELTRHDLASFLRLIAQKLIANFDLLAVAGEILNYTSEFFDADGSAILSYQKDRDVLRFVATHSHKEEIAQKLNNVEIPVGTGIAGWVARECKPLLVNDVNSDSRFNAHVDSVTEYQTQNIIAAPIILGEDLIGVIEVVNRADRPFFFWDLHPLSVVATVVAICAEKERINTKRDYFEQAADKAEIANSVLHNIGNMLNSVNVASSLVESRLERSRLTQFHMTLDLIKQHQNDLGAYLTDDPKGKLVPEFLFKLGEEFQKEQDAIKGEIRKVADKTNIMRDIIETQQTNAKMGFTVAIDLAEITEQSLVAVRSLLKKSGVDVKKNFQTGKPVHAPASKIQSILVNIIKNAVEAMTHTDRDERYIEIETGENGEGLIYYRISDNGHGMEASVLKRLFTHGFTTKDQGHGFGLASCRKMMEEMQGSITAHSDGLDKGSTFTLVFPPPKPGPEL